jgi:hypothetical protein
MTIWVLTTFAVAAALLSAYGWWFHFNVGPTHGAGLELGIVGGLLTAGMLILLLRSSKGHRRERR